MNSKVNGQIDAGRATYCRSDNLFLDTRCSGCG